LSDYSVSIFLHLFLIKLLLSVCFVILSRPTAAWAPLSSNLAALLRETSAWQEQLSPVFTINTVHHCSCAPEPGTDQPVFCWVHGSRYANYFARIWIWFRPDLGIFALLKNFQVKGTVSRDFRPSSFSSKHPSWAPD
jgi:hypothetical protein